MLTLEYIVSFLLPLTGLACLFFSEYITSVLPWVLGISMLLLGGIRILFASLRILHGKPKVFSMGINFIFVVLGLLFLLQGESSMTLIGVLWGLIGVWKSALSFQRAAEAIHDQRRYVPDLLLSLFRLALGLLLLLEPEGESISHHIIILGLDILVDTAHHPLHHTAELLKKKFHASRDLDISLES